MRPGCCRGIGVGLLIVMPASNGICQSFHPLGFLPGTDRTLAHAITADGTVAFGGGTDENGSGLSTPARWTLVGGLEPLAVLPDDVSATANDASSDGATVVGQISTPGTTTFEREAFRWTEDDGIIRLGDLPGGGTTSYAFGVSADGQTVVGSGTSAGPGDGRPQAFRWTPNGGMQGLGFLPDKTDQSFAYDVSGDGSVVVGFASRTEMIGELQMNYHEAFRWTEESGMVGLGDFPGGEFFSFANAITTDGSVIVGNSWGQNGTEAFRWTEADGMVALGMLPSHSGLRAYSSANAVSADGSVIVGTSTWEAMVWDQVHGLRSISGILTENGVDLSGWRLQQAVDVSADGRTILGYGVIGDGPEQPWVATLPASAFIPEPATGRLFALGIAVVLLMGQIRMP